MKIYIYRNLIDNANIQSHNQMLATANKLHQHLQYLLDFYEKFKEFETTNADEADYFFVPLFLVGWQFANHDPVDFINSFCQYVDRGNHILLATGDFGQRAELMHEMKKPDRAYAKKYEWMDTRFILLALESTVSLLAKDIAFLPYSLKDEVGQNVRKDIFASFMGAMSYDELASSHIRGGRLLGLKSNVQKESGFLIGSLGDVAERLGQSISYHALMNRSIFTLCPAGYGRWSFRLMEALLCNSIPVILADDYLLPFSDKIKWKDYCIVYPEADLDKLPEFLKALPAHVVHTLRANIERDKSLFLRGYTLNRVAEILNERIPWQDTSDWAGYAISKMRSPYEMGIICVDVTNKCDLACSNCTRLLENQDAYWEMTPANFRTALQSLRNYKGVIAMIGGNPCMHTRFEELCAIFEEEVPNRRQRGLWTNNIFKHKGIVEKTFGGFNLNPHNNTRAVTHLRELYEGMVVRDGWSGGFYPENSDHSPLLTAVKDIYPEQEMWEKISGCDINREWSATIVQNMGNLRIYFCEVAASFDLARNEDHGYPVEKDWWNKPIAAFSSQVKKFCPGCGVPARLKGNFDHEEIDTYTVSNRDIAEKSKVKKKRKVIFLQSDTAVGLGHKVTNYASSILQLAPTAMSAVEVGCDEKT